MNRRGKSKDHNKQEEEAGRTDRGYSLHIEQEQEQAEREKMYIERPAGTADESGEMFPGDETSLSKKEERIKLAGKKTGGEDLLGKEKAT